MTDFWLLFGVDYIICVASGKFGEKLNKKDLENIVSKIENEGSIFSKKAYLDTITFPSTIVGRQKKAEELTRTLLGYKQGFVVPFVSVYGRSGSGKTTLVKFVCENLDDTSYCFVNLRKARTIFGCANLILAELDRPTLKSAQGIQSVIDKIGSTVKSIIQKNNSKIFFLVLDEFDTLFYDKRGKPSDFIYKLLVLEENLRSDGKLICIIGISNNVLSDYEIDDRIRSRIGNSEIFFEPYLKEEILEILKERAKEAFVTKIDYAVLEKCADLSSQEHGDARRAIDLLRVAAELASAKNETLSVLHVEKASDDLQKDRVIRVLENMSFHLKQLFIAIARLAFLTDESWQPTSLIYRQYRSITEGEQKLLSPRRISELLKELENAGLLVSQTSSKGRYGYGTQYKLTISPETIEIFNPDMLKNWQENKKKYYDLTHEPNFGSSASMATRVGKISRFEGEKSWRKYVGID